MSQYIEYVVANRAEILGIFCLMFCLVLCHTEEASQRGLPKLRAKP